MRTTGRAATSVAAFAVAAALGLGMAGPASAATTTRPDSCTGSGPAATLSQAKHDAFQKEMAELKAQRDAIRAKYAKATRAAGQGKGTGPRSTQARRGSGSGTVASGTTQRTAMRRELAAWRVTRDALFAKYGLTARGRARSA